MYEVDLYVGIYSKLLFLCPFLFVGLSSYRLYYLAGFINSGYGYATPFELYLSLIISLLLRLKGPIFIETFTYLALAFSILLLGIYLALLYRIISNQARLTKIFFVTSIIIDLILLAFQVLPKYHVFIIYSPLQFTFLIMNYYRLKTYSREEDSHAGDKI